MHLFADISGHGLGHLAISAPILNALARKRTDLRLTIRSAIPTERLRQRIGIEFTHWQQASDFGFRMLDALSVDRIASAAEYREVHADWDRRVARDAATISDLAPDLVFANVSYLALAGAAAAGVPAIAACSLNWADLFAHFFGGEAWAAPIHAEMLAAYRSASAFLRITPGMPMAKLARVVPIGVVASPGRPCDLGLPTGTRAVLLALGGISHRLPVEDWPTRPDIFWILPEEWRCRRADTRSVESFGLAFPDLLASVDAVVTKPGYGTFTEAAVNGTPVIFQRRADWPEQDCLIEWLTSNGNCIEVSGSLNSGIPTSVLEHVASASPRRAARPTGAEEAAEILMDIGSRASGCR